MNKTEKNLLRSSIDRIVHDNRDADRESGWKMLCELAGLNLMENPAPFRDRTAKELVSRQSVMAG